MPQRVDTMFIIAYQQESDGPCCGQSDQRSAGYSVAVIENIPFPDKSAWKSFSSPLAVHWKNEGEDTFDQNIQ